jgi:catechol 2,3-dioxygenase-like lactoylglutathione lyase family enzyme
VGAHGRGRAAAAHHRLAGRIGAEPRLAANEAGFALRVADVAAARAELEANGVEFVAETWDSGVCHFAAFRDPDGNVLILHRRYAPRTAPD